MGCYSATSVDENAREPYASREHAHARSRGSYLADGDEAERDTERRQQSRDEICPGDGRERLEPSLDAFSFSHCVWCEVLVRCLRVFSEFAGEE